MSLRDTLSAAVPANISPSRKHLHATDSEKRRLGFVLVDRSSADSTLTHVAERFRLDRVLWPIVGRFLYQEAIGSGNCMPGHGFFQYWTLIDGLREKQVLRGRIYSIERNDLAVCNDHDWNIWITPDPDYAKLAVPDEYSIFVDDVDVAPTVE